MDHNETVANDKKRVETSQNDAKNCIVFKAGALQKRADPVEVEKYYKTNL